MTGIRQSIVFQIEDKYGEGNPSRINDEGIAVNYWVAAPPGSFFSSTHRRNVSRIQSMGSKFWDTVAYGTLQGTWEWTFYLDYNYPEPLFLIFEGGQYTNVYARNILEFTKNNNKRIPSFTVRRKLLNDFIGGADNEVSILKGCVVKSATFSKPSGASYIQVSMSGFYATEELSTMTEEQMDETDYTEYEGNLVEYGCLTSAELSEADTNNASLIQNTDNVSITIDNSAEQIFSTCSAFSTEYAEGLSRITMSASSYANHPNYYKAGVYTGGKDFNNIVDVLSSGATIAPSSKGMRPLDDAYLTSYDAMARYTNGVIGKAYGQSAASSRSSEMHLEDVVMNNLTWQKGDGGKLMDSVSGCPVRKLTIKLTTPATQPYTESAEEDSWNDLFYSVAGRREDGTKLRVNNVFVEEPEAITDQYGIVYMVDKNKGTAVVYSAPAGLEGDIDLLNHVTTIDGNRYPVIAIERAAFYSTSARPVSITSIHIPPNIRTIGNIAFYNVSTLTTVTGGTSLVDGVIDPSKGVTSIGTTAFRDCTSLTSCSLLASSPEEPVPLKSIGAGAFMNTAITEAVIPAGATIGQSNQGSATARAQHGAFAQCSDLVRVTLPVNINYVGQYDGQYYDLMFYNCNRLTEFSFVQGDDEVPDYSPEEGAAYDGDPSKCPYRFTPWIKAANRAARVDLTPEPTDVVIEWDESVRSIPRFMFCLTATDVQPVETEGTVTYRGMTYKMEPETMEGITSVGRYAFCRSGLDVQLEEDGVRTLRMTDVEFIESNAFVDLPNVQRFVLASEEMTSMPSDILVYRSTSNPLEEIDLGGCVAMTVMAREFVVRCLGLMRVTLPPKISRLSKAAFVMRGSYPRNIMFRTPAQDGSGWVKATYGSDGNVEDISLLRSSDGVTPRRFVRNDQVTPDSEDDVYRYFDGYGTYANLAPMTYGALNAHPYTWADLGDSPMYELQAGLGMVVTSVRPGLGMYDEPDIPSDEGEMPLDS